MLPDTSKKKFTFSIVWFSGYSLFFFLFIPRAGGKEEQEVNTQEFFHQQSLVKNNELFLSISTFTKQAYFLLLAFNNVGVFDMIVYYYISGK